MPSGFPEEVQIERWGDTTRCIFPRRNTRETGCIGAFFIVFGLIVTIFMVGWMSGPLREASRDDSPIRWFLLVFGLLGLPGLAVGLALLIGGIALTLNLTHSEIVLTSEELISIERFGALRFRRRRKRAAVNELVIGPMIKGENGKPAPTQYRNICMLSAKGHGIKPLPLAPGYNRELLHEVANELANYLPVDVPPVGVEAPTEIEVHEEDPSIIEQEDVFEKPEKCSVICHELPNGITLAVPPAGLWKGSKGLFFFSLLWNGFMAVFLTVIIHAALSDKGDAPPIGVYLFIGLFVAVGIAMLIGAINMGTRKVMLAVVDDTFAYRQISFTGTKEAKLRREDVAAVRVGPSGMEVNDVPVMELQIVPREGKKIGLLSERRNEELHWIASLLRRSLRVPPGSSHT